MKKPYILKLQKLTILYLFIPVFVMGQNSPDVKSPTDFKCFINVTNNGISLIPSFSLGKPAAIVEFQAGRRYTFEPQFRFALEGKPWSFIFWNRYKLLKPGKFQVTAGGHPAILFGTKTVSEDGASKEVIVSHRYLAGELSPNYSLTKKISAGFYYLYSYGFDEGTRNTHMIAAKMGFLSVPLFGKLSFNFVPQVYYLRMDEKDGFYFTSFFSIARQNFPLSVSSTINNIIQTEIKGSNFIWNITLTYTFSKKYIEMQ